LVTPSCAAAAAARGRLPISTFSGATMGLESTGRGLFKDISVAEIQKKKIKKKINRLK
jgi:Spy/CpxP family protein refolding chaperone